MRVVISGPARADLKNIWFDIALHNPAAADRLVRRLRGAVEPLADFPDLGVSRPELVPGARMLVENPYLVFYLVDRRAVRVVRIVHGARRIGPDLFS